MNTFKDFLSFLTACFVGAIIIAGIGGWIANIVKLASVDVFNGLAVLRAIGFFVAPLGAVLGFV